ncbi:MAG TPA: DUF1772 domain-containing protein [Sphingomonas sp.]|nr:DUF1772 domain-containing protein [Sphingomonas sp.]
MLPGLAALVLATLFTGAALYISLVEHPARLVLHDAALLAQWQSSYMRALPIQAGLALLGTAVGLVVWYRSDGWQWLVGSLTLLANWPFTMFVIMPTNKRLLAMRQSEAGPESRRMLLRWAALHHVRSALGCIAVLLFLCGLVAAQRP